MCQRVRDGRQSAVVVPAEGLGVLGPASRALHEIEGPEGNGKLPLALAYAQYILCPHRTATDSCGVCPSCQKISKLTHPDLHFVVPTTTTKSVKSNPESDLFMTEWRDYVLQKEGYVDTS